MTENQRRFADEFLISGNATQAYKIAYPNIKSDRTAESSSARLRKRPDVEEYINKRLEEISSNKIAEAEEVMEYLTCVMRGESTTKVPIVLGKGDGNDEIAIIDKNPDEKERLKAAELIGKRYGLFTDKVNLQGSNKVVIVDDITD